MMCKIPISGKLAATISVVEYFKPFSDGDPQLLKLLGHCVAALLQRDGGQRSGRGILYEDFIADLLEGRLPDPDIVEERIRTLNIGLKNNVYVFLFDVSGYDPRRFSITYMRDVLEKMVSGGQAAIYDGKIVIAANFSRSRDIFLTELSNLGEFLKQHNIRCGISRRCAKPHELRFYYDQALDALLIGTYLV
jgi:hypothetical protein